MADELKFTTPEELEEWLKDKPIEWAQVIAARAALRVLPLVWQVFQSEKLSRREQDQLILSTYRACFISSAARNYPAEDMTYAAASAASAAYAARAAAARAAAASAASAAAAAAALAAASAAYAAYAARAARAADAAVDMWNAISHDTNWLDTHKGEGKEQARLLANMSTWPDGEPEWINKERSELTDALMYHSEYHLVWINWYNNVFTGKSFFDLSPAREKTLTLKIAKQENEFWEQDFAKVSEDISGWLEEARLDDAAEAAQQRLDDQEVDHSETSTDNVGNSTLAKSNGTTKLSIAQVDQNLLQVLTSVKAINESAAGRIASRPLKPNSGEALDNWNAEQDFLTLIEEKSGQISQSLMAMESPSDRQQAVEETSMLLEELFQEFESFVRTNKKELVDNIVRIPSAIILVGLANLVGASMITATPAIFAMVGGKKVYDLLAKKKDKTEN